jgi:tripartite-type tricarboxylate transporter receptor subunit TctC
MKFIARLGLSACLALAAATASAQAPYPSEPIKLIVPFPAGGTLDGLARMMQPKLSEIMGQPIVIENINGASGRVGTARVVKSKPDGYTMLMVYDTLPIDPILYKSTLPYDPLKDLAPVSLITRAPLIAIGNVDLPATNMAELVTYAKQNPTKINFGSTGTGSSSHLAGALFARTSDTQMSHIPYSGGAPMMTALIGGHVNLIWASTGFANQVMKSGKVRLLGQAGATRNRAFPDLKTLAEQGVPKFEVYSFFGLMAPAGTPDAVVQKWNDALKLVAARPDSQAWFAQNGYEAVVSSPRDFGEFIKAENTKWAKIIKDENIPVQ